MINLSNPETVKRILLNDCKFICEQLHDTHIDNRDEWLQLLFILRMVQINECEDESLWDEFREELLHKNRFHPQSELLKKIEELASSATIILQRGINLFRCREYSTDNFFENPFVMRCIEYVQNMLPELAIELKDFQSYAGFSMIISLLAEKPGIVKDIEDRINKIVSESDGFWGYDKIDSDAPRPEFTKAMRVSPEGIAYLYTARDVRTALKEMRPQIGQTYSVANIEIIDDVKLFDISNESIDVKNANDKRLFSRNVLDKLFSEANYGNPIEYIPMQYICEYIRHLGFDGIQFRSSVSLGGKNVVLFDVTEETKKYRITGSEVYGINNTEIAYTKVLPFSDEEIGNLFDINYGNA